MISRNFFQNSKISSKVTYFFKNIYVKNNFFNKKLFKLASNLIDLKNSKKGYNKKDKN